MTETELSDLMQSSITAILTTESIETVSFEERGWR